MPSILLYLLKVSVSLAAVFLFYQLVLRRLTFYNWNRWYLLGYTLLCFFVPFIDVSPVLEQNKWADSSIVNWVPVIRQSPSPGRVAGNMASPLSVTQWVSVLLVAGMLIMLVRLLLQLISFRRMIQKATFISGESMKLYQVNEPIIPFSFGNAVFINTRLHSEAELQEIIRHEFVHVRQKHSVDIVWSEWLCLVSWFNPFAWLLKKAIRQNLEFIADSKVLENGISKKEYQYLLLKVTGNHQYSIATPFNFSSLKKRIAMMNKLQSAKVNLLRFLFILPLLAVILVSFREEIGDSLKRHSKLSAAIPPGGHTDTIPGTKNANKKGYFISITGKADQSMVVVKDKNRKEIARVPLADWNEKSDYFEGLYGQLPPPPPPPPPPHPGELKEIRISTVSEFLAKHDDVKEVSWVFNRDNTVAIIHISRKDGSSERYDLANSAEMEKAVARYGALPMPPPPGIPPPDLSEKTIPGMPLPEREMELMPKAAPGTPLPPAPPGSEAMIVEGVPVPPEPSRLPENVRSININDQKAKVILKNGTVENYDLSVPAEKKAFEKKYGPPPSIPMTPGPDRNSAAAEFSYKGDIVKVNLKNGRKEEYNLADPVERAEFKTLYANPVIAPVQVKKVTGLRSTSPLAESAITVAGLQSTGPVKSDAVVAPVSLAGTAVVENAVIQVGGLSMQDDGQYILVDGKEYSPSAGGKLKGTYRITFIDKKEAVKKYGGKARNGAILVETIKAN